MTIKSALVTIFKHQNPIRILQNYFVLTSYQDDNHTRLNQNIFVDIFQQEEVQCSKNEAENMYYYVKEKMGDSKNKRLLDKSVFNLIVNYASDKLENEGDNVKCRYKDLLKWRMLTLELDQDMFICSYLAYEDTLIRRSRNNYDWDIVVKSNNKRLHHMLSEGIAENHFHLKGSAPIFKLSWVSLMNHLECRKQCNIVTHDSRLDKDMDGNVEIESLIFIAALIRVILFHVVMEIPSKKEEKDTGNQDLNQLLYILQQIVNPKDFIHKSPNDFFEVSKEFISMYSSMLQEEINALKYLYGTSIRYNNHDVRIDYAMGTRINKKDKSTRLFSGERWFMYECFQGIYSGNETVLKYADLFYAYIIIKNKVRAELVQQNGRVGFANFADYQDRKTKYIKKNTIISQSVESSAILNSNKNQNIVSLEARVMPKYDYYKNVADIKRMDDLITNQIFQDHHNSWSRELDEDRLMKDELTNLEWSLLQEKDIKEGHNLFEKYFYVYHFPKEEDKKLIDIEQSDGDRVLFLTSKCRHYIYRQKLRKWANAIYLMRENNQEVAIRLRGIDACSNELVIRPEVYGQTFRYLKGHIPSRDFYKLFDIGYSLPRLRATYHVGEDFLDVIDGLRAIDEARIFLNLTHGDRLGHAIALGIDVEYWYKNKNNRVYLTKHAILDNVAWLIHKVKEYAIPDTAEIIEILTSIYNDYYVDIYIYKGIEEKGYFTEKSSGNLVPVDTFMKAWELRGDNPEYYFGDDVMKNELSYWDRCARREDVTTHRSDLILELYRRYHYDYNVKYRGEQKEVFKVTPQMIRIIKQVQKYMQRQIRQCGIGVECNPSSNVLISNFKRYDKHPILNMYNKDLYSSYDNEYGQLFVSINTDDQGVFDTLLENEYALMAIALEKCKNEEGESIFNQADIYNWLDSVRRMGIEQSFHLSKN